MFRLYSSRYIIADNAASDSESTTQFNTQAANVIHKENIELMEYPFLTLSIYPEDFIIHLGNEFFFF